MLPEGISNEFDLKRNGFFKELENFCCNFMPWSDFVNDADAVAEDTAVVDEQITLFE